MTKTYYTYIMASKRDGDLYVGVTSNLSKRVRAHKKDRVEGFAANCGTHRLVYFEQHLDAATAIRRENRLRLWHRNWKLALIEIDNPNWRDLYHRIAGARRDDGTRIPAQCQSGA